MFVAFVQMVQLVRGLSVLVLVLALVAGVRVLVAGPWSWVVVEPGGVEVGLRLDVLSVLLLGFVAAVMVLVTSYSIRNLVGRAGTTGFGWLLLAALGSLALMMTGASLPVVAVGWTGSGWALVGLVAHADTPSARRAARHVGRRLLLGDASVWSAVLLGLLWLPSLNRADLPAAGLSGWSVTVVAGLLVVGCVVRSALVPARSWLVETAEAPSPVSALLHAGMVNGAGVMVTLFWALFRAAPEALLALLVVGAASVVVGALTMSVRTDVKGRLAGSTTTQMGYMSVQLGLGLPAAAVAHLIGHGCYKAWLFLRAGGAVTRARREPTASLVATAAGGSTGPATALGAPHGVTAMRGPWGRPRGWVVIVAVTLLASAGALPAVLVAVGSLGLTALLPVSAALATLVVALSAACRPDLRMPGTTISRSSGTPATETHHGWERPAVASTSWVLWLLAAAGAGAVVVYAWLLVAFEGFLAAVLPLEPVWSAPVSALLVVGVAVFAVATVVLMRRVREAPDGRVATRLALDALPPWSRRLNHPLGVLAAPLTWTAPARRPSRPHNGQPRSELHKEPHVRVTRGVEPGEQHLDGRDPAVPVSTNGGSTRGFPPGQRPTLGRARLEALVQVAARGTSPAWPLRSMVAANPLAGLEGFTHHDAATISTRLHGTRGYLPLARYQDLHQTGRITREHLLKALRQLRDERGEVPDPGHDQIRADHLLRGTRLPQLQRPARDATTLLTRSRSGLRLINHVYPDTPDAPALDTPAPYAPAPGTPGPGAPARGAPPVDEPRDVRPGARRAAAWTTARADARAFVDDHAGLWCARAWSQAQQERQGGPWAAWRSAASHPTHDRAVAMVGLHRLVRALPEDPHEALAELLTRTGHDPAHYGAYLSELLSAAPGWAAHAAWRAREQDDPTPMVQLLAVRAALDVLVAVGLDVTITDDGQNRLRPNGRTPEEGCDRIPANPASLGEVGAEQVEHGSGVGLPPEAVWQRAYELGYREALLSALRPAVSSLAARRPATMEAGAAQLVFCIDVRSERLRRAIESVGEYGTFGFAGFFGVALRYTSAEGASFDQCPALIRPVFDVTTTSMAASPAPDANPAPHPSPSTTGRPRAPELTAAISAVHASPLTALLAAEAGGAVTAAAAVARTFAPARWRALVRRWHRGQDRWGTTRLVDPLTLSQRTAIAHDVLRSLGLVSGFARLLIICGHGGSVENNAFASAYDCGACGGNSGHINARVLAAILNDPAVRDGLVEHGIRIPAITTAVAAVHDTTTDEVTLDPFAFRGPSSSTRLSTDTGTDSAAAAPSSTPDRELLTRVQADLLRAGHAARTERARTLPGAPTFGAAGSDTAAPQRPDRLLRHVRARAGDWAQPCPEWGLAGNAAFVVGPRALTRGLNLQGRVFLHDYDPALDQDDSILTTILTAPAVVTQWINAQYYASTVDHEAHGAGDKATHNVVGDVGVLSGAHGDLRLGLPWQALFTADPAHHPDRAQHEPLRQLVVVWAPLDRLDRVLQASPAVHALLRNEWMSMTAIDPTHHTFHLLTPQMSWRDWPEPAPLPVHP